MTHLPRSTERLCKGMGWTPPFSSPPPSLGRCYSPAVGGGLVRLSTCDLRGRARLVESRLSFTIPRWWVAFSCVTNSIVGCGWAFIFFSVGLCFRRRPSSIGLFFFPSFFDFEWLGCREGFFPFMFPFPLFSFRFSGWPGFFMTEKFLFFPRRPPVAFGSHASRGLQVFFFFFVLSFFSMSFPLFPLGTRGPPPSKSQTECSPFPATVPMLSSKELRREFLSALRPPKSLNFLDDSFDVR